MVHTIISTISSINYALISNLKLVKAGSNVSVTIKTLMIDPEFEAMTNPIYIDNSDESFDEQKKDDGKDEKEEKRQIRLELLENRLAVEKQVAPFKVWEHRGKLVILDSRYDEYRIAVKLHIPIETITYKFATKKEAMTFVILNQLSKPNLSTGHRILLARQLKDYYSKCAKATQGRRNDLLIPSQRSTKSFNTTKTLSAIANVGENSFRRMDQLVGQGIEYLGKEKTDELIQRILDDNLSITSAWIRLRDAKKRKNEKADYFNGLNNDKHDESEGPKENTKTEEYTNPSIEKDFHNKIVCGDHIRVLNQLPDASVNLVLTSPVYNVPSVKYHIDIPVLPHYIYLKRLADLWRECGRILRDGGRLVINLPAIVSVFNESKVRAFNTPLFIDVVNQIKELDVGLNFRDIIVWSKRYPYKKNPLGTASPSNPCLRATHEYLLVFSKNKWEMTAENPNAPHDMTMEDYKECSNSVWSIAPQAVGVGNHPAVFPSDLAERVIRMFSFVGDTVVDGCNGSGTSTANAALLGRRWFGCDISPKYCEVAENRTQKAYKQFLKSIKDVDDEAQEHGNKAA